MSRGPWSRRGIHGGHRGRARRAAFDTHVRTGCTSSERGGKFESHAADPIDVDDPGRPEAAVWKV